MVNKLIRISCLILIALFVSNNYSFAGIGQAQPLFIYQSSLTDSSRGDLASFFDLRDRETFIQITNTSDTSRTIHIRIFDVSNNCNENDFFDVFTPNDTHVYNLRELLTNDGNPSGVVLPDNAYGYVSIERSSSGPPFIPFVGNMRILDDSGYEYRTNLTSFGSSSIAGGMSSPPLLFNFNKKAGIELSDIVIVTYPISGDIEFDASGIINSWFLFDVDIVDNDENLFSCRDVVTACVDDDNPLRETLLEVSGGSVASFEWGINEAIPHSRGGELLCPGNTIEEGIVSLVAETQSFGLPSVSEVSFTFGFIGFNNGNGRGSMDTWWNLDENTIFQ